LVTHNVVRVMMWKKTVGALSMDSSSGICAFQYDPEWINSGIEINPIKLPLSDRIYQFPSLSKETYKGLPGAFADTLPDNFGNAVINAWLARNGRDSKSFTSLERLLYTGKRGMGALEYHPSTKNSLNSSNIIKLDSLVEMAQSVLNQRSKVIKPIMDKENHSLSEIFQVGTSAGGARPKAVIGINKERTEIRSGQVDLPPGFEHYLLKFDGVVEPTKSKETFGDPQGYGCMEYAYYLMAKDAGINISNCEILQDHERSHFITKRFDRIKNKKIHYQSLCAMDHADFSQPGHYSYEQLFSLMRTLRLPKDQALQLYRRMVFNIIARNHDDHTKNFGFILNNNHKWQLAPAFDIAYSYKPGSPWVNSHQLSLNGKRENFTRNDLLQPAQKFIKEANDIINEVIETVSTWKTYAKTANVFKPLIKEISKNHRLYL
jgi:serine/threonine-protein kinase HipA